MIIYWPDEASACRSDQGARKAWMRPSGNYDVINVPGSENMDAISVVRRVAGKRVERIGSTEDKEAAKDKV